MDTTRSGSPTKSADCLVGSGRARLVEFSYNGNRPEEVLKRYCLFMIVYIDDGWLGSRVVSVLDSGAEGPGFKSQSRRCRVTVLGKLFTPIVPLFTKQQNW